MISSLRPQDLDDLYKSLSPTERDELLRTLLYAASISGEMVLHRLEEQISRSAGHECDHEPAEQTPSSIQA